MPHSLLEDAIDRQRLRPRAGRKYALKKFIAPRSREPAVSDAERDGGSDLIGMVQLKLGKPCSKIGLSHEYAKVRVLIEEVAIGVEENRQVADAENLECQRISMGIAAGEFGKYVEVATVAVPLDAKANEPGRAGGIPLLLQFEFGAICRYALRDEFAALRRGDSPTGP